MPGFGELAKTTGFATHKPLAHGFSQYTSSGYSYEHPAVGFGAALKKYEEEKAAVARRARKPRAPKGQRPESKTLPWPVGSIGKLINYRETPDWKDFPEGIPVTARDRK